MGSVHGAPYPVAVSVRCEAAGFLRSYTNDLIQWPVWVEIVIRYRSVRDLIPGRSRPTHCVTTIWIVAVTVRTYSRSSTSLILQTDRVPVPGSIRTPTQSLHQRARPLYKCSCGDELRGPLLSVRYDLGRAELDDVGSPCG